MNELQQAIELNEESKQLRAEATQALSASRDLFDKTVRFSEQASINQRRLAFAVSSLMPKSLRNDFNLNESDIENTSTVSRENVEVIRKREMLDILHAVNVLAVTNADVIHIFVSYSAHINCLQVYARKEDYEYQQGDTDQRLFDRNIWLNDDDALKQLLEVESQLTELIIDAREKTEAQEGVEA
ncbi:hypothetical protein BS333_09545 [Vibrio azureus]|uniref:Uncharacterized protein n=1 Tax=Vibrio azureus NBRC 104587 TaxID=1219077 RepID=U3AMN7_9VIBR|nr:hypothetical protein [Vibrio azureus]AUI86606.1 hypothetical protein BS333_09545 [Vibrio azureus]GAD75035.1 hypothetical protein VAZ01S_018_00110 [Vibrio azureus NBRC 104587]